MHAHAHIHITLHADEDNKQDDIQIGFPTDVKHVAHIGWDGPTIDSPSWVPLQTKYYNLMS